jgi:hypothetical protein
MADDGYDLRLRLDSPFPAAILAPYLYFEIAHVVPWLSITIEGI